MRKLVLFLHINYRQTLNRELWNTRHTARFTDSMVRVHYFCHPLFGQEVNVLERRRHGDEIYYLIMLFDNSRVLLPAWMTDELACRGLKLQESLECSVGALIGLGELLDRSL